MPEGTTPAQDVEIIAPEKKVQQYFATFENQMVLLEEDNQSLVFEYETKDGEKEARSHVHALRRSKTAIETARKDEKAASLEYGRLLDGVANTLKDRVDAMIAVHMKPLDEKTERETARINGITARVNQIKAYGVTTDENGMLLSAATLKNLHAALEATWIDETFQEFSEEAATAKAAVLVVLSAAIPGAEKQEAEQRELAELRAKNAEREKADEEERLREEGRKRAEADEKARAEREEDDKQKRAADAEHRASVNGEALDALMKHAGLSGMDAELVVEAIARGEITHIKIAY